MARGRLIECGECMLRVMYPLLFLHVAGQPVQSVRAARLLFR
jgi:hypothetical protein